MENAFKSAMDRIKAEDTLKKKTEVYLMNANNSNVTPLKSLKNNKIMKRAIAAACVAVLLCGSSVGAYAYYKTPVSYVSLDINPSVELGVNPLGTVVTATAYNGDGSTILDGQNVTNTSVENAVNTLVTSAADNGFIADDGSTVISVTSETDNSTTATQLQNEAEQGAETAVQSGGDTASVISDNVALARRDEARKLGITPGKLNLIQKLQALDPTISVDQYKDAKVKDIQKKFIELKKNAKSKGTTSSSTSSNSSSSTTSSEVTSSSSEGTSSVAPSESSSTVTAAALQSSSSKKNNTKKHSSTSVTSSIANTTSSLSASSSSTGRTAHGNGNGGKSPNSNSNKNK